MSDWRHRLAQSALLLLPAAVAAFAVVALECPPPAMIVCGIVIFTALSVVIAWLHSAGAGPSQLVRLLPGRIMVLVLTRTRRARRWLRFESQFWEYVDQTRREPRNR